MTEHHSGNRWEPRPFGGPADFGDDVPSTDAAEAPKAALARTGPPARLTLLLAAVALVAAGGSGAVLFGPSAGSDPVGQPAVQQQSAPAHSHQPTREEIQRPNAQPANEEYGDHSHDSDAAGHEHSRSGHGDEDER